MQRLNKGYMMIWNIGIKIRINTAFRVCIWSGSRRRPPELIWQSIWMPEFGIFTFRRELFEPWISQILPCWSYRAQNIGTGRNMTRTRKRLFTSSMKPIWIKKGCDNPVEVEEKPSDKPFCSSSQSATFGRNCRAHSNGCPCSDPTNAARTSLYATY